VCMYVRTSCCMHSVVLCCISETYCMYVCMYFMCLHFAVTAGLKPIRYHAALRSNALSIDLLRMSTKPTSVQECSLVDIVVSLQIRTFA
jgi:hypothetical protein